MEYFIIICFSVFILGCRNENAINQLQVKNDVVIKMLENFDNKKYIKNEFHGDSGFVYLNISEEPIKIVTAKISMIDKTDFCFFDRVPYGFLNYKKNTVFVYGNKASSFFENTSEKQYFDYLPKIEPVKKNVEVKKDKNEIHPPPIFFEPVDYVYKLKDNGFKLIFVDMNFNYQIIYLDDSTVTEEYFFQEKKHTITYKINKKELDTF
jgi:hypothetical protein